MIAGRTRFYVVAAIVGSIAGEALAALVAIAATHLPVSARATLPLAAVLLVFGTVGGAYAGVSVLRRWYRRRVHSTRSAP